MKKEFFASRLIIFLLALLIVSCEKSTDDPAKLLIGNWDQESTTIVHYYDNIKQNEIVNNYNPGEFVLEIYDNGTANKYLNGVLNDAFYWAVDGNLFIMTSNNGLVMTAEFSIKGSILTLKWAVEDNSDGHTSRSEYVSIYKQAK